MSELLGMTEGRWVEVGQGWKGEQGKCPRRLMVQTRMWSLQDYSEM